MLCFRGCCFEQLVDQASLLAGGSDGRRWLETHGGGVHEAPNPADYLFDVNDVLMKYLREADRLWMLTVDGIHIDLERDRKKAEKKADKENTPRDEVRIDPLGRIHGNIRRHREEMQLYQRFCPDQVAAYEFQQGLLLQSQ